MFLSLFVPEPKVSVDATRRDDYRVSPQVFFGSKYSQDSLTYTPKVLKLLKDTQRYSNIIKLSFGMQEWNI